MRQRPLPKMDALVAWYSQTWNWFDGEWHEGNPPILGPRSHAAWLGSSVFDGPASSRASCPTSTAHCARVNRSARRSASSPPWPRRRSSGPRPRGREEVRAGRGALREADVLGRGRRPGDHHAPIRIRPGSACVSTRRRCRCRGAPGDEVELSPPDPRIHADRSKAGCLYPNNARVIREAKAKGFDNALVCDALGNVAETGTANVFMAKDGVVLTPAAERHVPERDHPPARDPAPARRRRPVVEGTLRYEDFAERGRDLHLGQLLEGHAGPAHRRPRPQPGPFYRRARELYWDFAHSRAA